MASSGSSSRHTEHTQTMSSSRRLRSKQWPANTTTSLHRLCCLVFCCFIAQFAGAFSPTCRRNTAVRGSYCATSIKPIAAHGVLKGRRHFATASSTTDGEGGGPPKYRENALARVVFSNPYFYGGDEDLANFCSSKRIKILGDLTVCEVQQNWKTEKEQSSLAESIGASVPKVIAALIPERVEDKLHLKQIFAINGAEEIETIDDKHVSGVPSTSKALVLLSKQPETPLPKDRPRPIYLIMGPSGSGKTFVAANEVATHAVGHTKQVTLYVQPNSISNYKAAADSHKNGILMNCIQEKLANKFGYDPEQKLNMHVTIVLDEIQRGDHFDNVTNHLLTFFDDHVKEFADSVRLVACGTGLTGEHLGTNVDCYKIHLSHWSREDVAVVLAERWITYTEDRENVLNAIYDHSVLKALTTNARTAGYLLEEIVPFTNQLECMYVECHQMSNYFHAAAPYFLETVVSRYTAMNGLQRLNAEERRRVAAFAFGAVEKARDRSKLEPPDLEGLNTMEAAVAWSLLDHNLEYSSLKTTKLLRLNERSILVSPAISAVLFDMLGSKATIYSDWKGQAKVSALYAYRQEVLKILVHFQSNHENGLMDFDNNLAKLNLVLIRKPVPPNSTTKKFIVPSFAKNTIWINGERAPFADVIAPYMLLQCKHTSVASQRVEVDLDDELDKCGLLRDLIINTDTAKSNKNAKKDKGWGGLVAMRAIWFMWSDEYEDHHFAMKYIGQKTEDPSVSDAKLQASLAFPENTLVGPNSGDNVESVTVFLENDQWWIVNGNQSVEVPELSSLFKPGKPRVSFVISTNSPQLVVKDKKSSEVICKLCIDDLQKDGRVNLDLLAKRNEKEAWQKFEAKIVDGVDVKFLFT